MLMSELILLLLLVVLSSQSSSLWTSVMSIPFSVVIILLPGYNMSFYLFIYVMVFIGGLLVLLVSVASISYQDQSFNMFLWWSFFLLLLSSLFLVKPLFISGVMQSSLYFTNWLKEEYLVFILMILLIISLLVLTKNLFFTKGMIRLS